ncbi:MAG TPA: hydrolase [Firmicutes bacterium]|nr:hydrolase [Bacillota bacterium]
MITRDEAWQLLCEYNKEPFHLRHGEVVEGVMRYFARQLGYGEEEEFWGIVGLLHDLDFERYPQEHCVKEQQIMGERGLDERLIHAVASHGYGLCCDIAPEHQMEKVLFAVDELTGLLGAAARMRPSKSVSDLELSSAKKKFKDKKFAAGCSRDVIQKGADMLGWSLDDLISQTILAMREDPQN